MRPILPFLLLTACAADPAEPAGVSRQAPLARPAEGAERNAAPIALEEGPDGISLRRADGWPGRALDPVLTVGNERLTRYDHPEPAVSRVFTDGRALAPGAPVVLQYGDDPTSRIVVRP